MTKYRILKREYPNGRIEYNIQKKIIGLFWWTFKNPIETGIYDTLEKAKRAIEMDKDAIKETIINVE